ncbi:MAG: DMT family transporter [Nocardioidaceae bacterium]
MTAVLALLSSVMWGGSDFLGGVLSRRRPALVVVAWAEAIGLLICTVFALVLGSWHGPIGWLPWGLAAGLVGCGGLVCYYAALASGTMGVVSPIASMGVIVPVLVGFLTGEAPQSWQVAGIVIAIVGVVLVSGPELTGGAPLRPVALAAVSGLCFGVFFIAMDGGAHVNTLMTLWAMRAGVVTLFAVAALVRRTTGGITVADLGLLAVVGSADLLANLLFGIAATRGYVSVASVLSSLYPVVTVLLGRLVLAERLRMIQAGGILVTLAGVAFISIG